MARTTHGHHIPGTQEDRRDSLVDMRACGGVDICARCQHEAREHIIYMVGEDVDYQQRAIDIVRRYVKPKQFPESPPFSVYVIWFTKTLQNWKAIMGTTLDDCMIYELTHDGFKNQTYLDAYHKVDNQVIPDSDL